MVAACVDRECPPGTVLELSRRAAKAFPGRVDAARGGTLVDNVGHWASRFKERPKPPPQPGSREADPRYSPGMGFGRATKAVAAHEECFRRLAACQGKDTKGEWRPF